MKDLFTEKRSEKSKKERKKESKNVFVKKERVYNYAGFSRSF